MAEKRFLSHLYAVKQPDGTARVTFDVPGLHDSFMSIDLVGPEPVKPPDTTLTEEAYNQWLEGLLFGGYSRNYSYGPMDCPPVQELPSADTLSDVRIRKDVVCGSHPSGKRTLVVEVENSGPVPVEQFRVEWVYDYETPQPDSFRGAAMATGGGRFGFFHPESSFTGTLQPGETRRFLLAPGVLPDILAHVAALSPERYWIGFMSGDYEFARIAGETVGVVVDELEA